MVVALIEPILEHFIAEESLLPFFIPLLGWTSAFLFCEFTNREFGRWTPVHNTHHAVGLLFASLSLFFNDESIFAERNGIFWSLSYFVVDFVDCVRSGGVAYSFHAICCIFLGVSNYNTPAFYSLRMNSKALFLELSTPILYLSKKTKKPLHFALFALVFTLCRIVWLPIMMRQLIKEGFPWTDLRFLVIVAFYG
jgi:hypothetical protein